MEKDQNTQLYGDNGFSSWARDQLRSPSVLIWTYWMPRSPAKAIHRRMVFEPRTLEPFLGKSMREMIFTLPSRDQFLFSQ